MKKVATYRGSFKEKFGVPRQAGVVPQLLGKIVLEKDYRTPDAIRGIEDFDYLWLIWGFSKNKHVSKGITVRPPRLGGNASMGVFATRSPYRPNPIGLSSVHFDHIDYDCQEAPVIYVRGADLVDETPIYDIKPYIPYTDAHSNARGGFTDRVGWKPLQVDLSRIIWSNEENKDSNSLDSPLLSHYDLDELTAILSQDIRPHYHDDPKRIYGMKYGDFDVRFRVEDKKVIVVEIKKQ